MHDRTEQDRISLMRYAFQAMGIFAICSQGRQTPASSMLHRLQQLPLLRLLIQQICIGAILLDDHRYREHQRRPVQLILILLAIEAVPQVHGPGDEEVSTNAGADVPGPVSATIPPQLHKQQFKTYHHPCPSNNMPHGNPSSLLHLRRLPQYLLSIFQIKNAPRNNVSPYPTINHISFNILVSLASTLFCSASSSALTFPPERARACFAFRRFRLGLRCSSCTIMARMRRVAVSRA